MTERKGHFILFYSTKSIYSNFHPAEFTDQELMRNLPESSEFFGQKDFRFCHVEQYMHACKAMLFLDYPVLDRILSTSDPKEAKELGRQVANFDDKVWTATARDIVTRGCVLKFGQNEELRQLMEDDGTDRQFVECAPRDRRFVRFYLVFSKCAKFTALSILNKRLMLRSHKAKTLEKTLFSDSLN